MASKKFSGPGRLGSIKRVRELTKSKNDNRVRQIPSESSLTVRFLHEVEDWHGYYEHWIGGKNARPVPCYEGGDCEGCSSDDPDERRKSFRYLANAFVVDDNAVKVIKMPKTLGEQLLDYAEKFGTLLDRDYDLMKKGSGMEGTRYSASPDAPSKKNISRYQLFDLEEIMESMGSDFEVEDDDEEDEPRSTKKSRPRSTRNEDPWDDEDEDEDDDDEEERSIKRPTKTKKSAKTTSKKSSTRRVVRR